MLVRIQFWAPKVFDSRPRYGSGATSNSSASLLRGLHPPAPGGTEDTLYRTFQEKRSHSGLQVGGCPVANVLLQNDRCALPAHLQPFVRAAPGLLAIARIPPLPHIRPPPAGGAGHWWLRARFAHTPAPRPRAAWRWSGGGSGWMVAGGQCSGGAFEQMLCGGKCLPRTAAAVSLPGGSAVLAHPGRLKAAQRYT